MMHLIMYGTHPLPTLATHGMIKASNKAHGSRHAVASRQSQRMLNPALHPMVLLSNLAVMSISCRAQFVDTAHKEIAALILSDEHPNIVRVFAMEEDAEFVYLALEYCDRNLAQLLHHSAGHSEFFDSRGQPTAFCMEVGPAGVFTRGVGSACIQCWKGPWGALMAWGRWRDGRERRKEKQPAPARVCM